MENQKKYEEIFSIVQESMQELKCGQKMRLCSDGSKIHVEWGRGKKEYDALDDYWASVLYIECISKGFRVPNPPAEFDVSNSKYTLEYTRRKTQ